MLDLSTLDTLTDRQLLIRLIALLTSLVKVQHCDHSVRDRTVCRNGANCSYQPNCWFRHTCLCSAASRLHMAHATPLPCHGYGYALAALLHQQERVRAARPATAPPP